MRLRCAFTRRYLSFVAVLFTVAVLIGSQAKAGPVLPDFSAANFAPGAPIDNPYFPLVPGTILHYTATVTDPDTGATGFQLDEDFVTGKTKTIAGVKTRIVRARSWLDHILIEDTNDYYAQDKSGNVWYMGEDTRAFEYNDAGQVINVDRTGSFQTGVNGAKPGFIMPANPPVGFFYFQEAATNDGALDQANVLSRSESVSVPAGSFSNVLKTAETSPLEPGVVENKFHAPGVGVVQVFEDIQPNGEPLNTFRLQSVSVRAVPLPRAVWMGLLTMALMFATAAAGAVMRRRSSAARA